MRIDWIPEIGVKVSAVIMAGTMARYFGLKTPMIAAMEMNLVGFISCSEAIHFGVWTGTPSLGRPCHLRQARKRIALPSRTRS